jgi:hypothetical protein
VRFNRPTRNRSSSIVKLNANGTVDPSFKSPFNTNVVLFKVIAAPEGKFFVAGKIPGATTNEFLGPVRLNPDGSIDPTWTPAQADGEVRDMISDRNGNLVIAGTL